MSQDDYNPQSVNATLSRIETKLNDALKAIDKQEDRITIIERWRYYALGAFAAAGIGAKLLFEKFMS